MTKQTEKIHIIEISKRLIERLEYIKSKPNIISDYSSYPELSTPLLQKTYPQAKIINTGKTDFIFAVLSHHTQDIASLFSEWKEFLRPSGFLMFALLDGNFDVCDVGDFLMHLGFIDVVIDLDFEVIYGYCMVPKLVTVPLTELRRDH